MTQPKIIKQMRAAVGKSREPDILDRLRAGLKLESLAVGISNPFLVDAASEAGAEVARLRAALDEETECARQTDDVLAKTEADNERLNKQGSDLAAIIRQQGFEIERLRAALQEIAGNKTNSRAWLEDKARRALGPKP